jgi:glucose-fructose oxidoreductase
VIGLGHIAQAAVLPAFANARKNSELVALVSGDEEKLRKLGRKYKIKNLFSYENVDDLLHADLVDAVYVALPNDQHADFTVRAMNAGLHVLCEKPMAMTTSDCLKMIEATKEAGTKLMIAYRLHFQKANMEVVAHIKKNKLGNLKFFSSVFSMQIIDDNNIRLEGKGGGTLFDIGTYCINSARYLFRAEPEQVFAFGSSDPEDERFNEIVEMASVVMKFPGNRLAQFTCSFGAANSASYEIVGTKGSIRLESAYEYTEPMKMSLTVDDKTTTKKFEKTDQFAAEIAYFSDCVMRDRKPEPCGHEGMADVRILEAIQKSIETNSPVTIDQVQKETRPHEGQVIDFPGISKPKTVKVKSPHS